MDQQNTATLLELQLASQWLGLESKEIGDISFGALQAKPGFSLGGCYNSLGGDVKC